jgi:hypothetical protein
MTPPEHLEKAEVWARIAVDEFAAAKEAGTATVSDAIAIGRLYSELAFLAERLIEFEEARGASNVAESPEPTPWRYDGVLAAGVDLYDVVTQDLIQLGEYRAERWRYFDLTGAGQWIDEPALRAGYAPAPEGAYRAARRGKIPPRPILDDPE